MYMIFSFFDFERDTNRKSNNEDQENWETYGGKEHE